jgi:hypothetical protein
MIAADKDDHVRPRLVENLPEFTHPGDGGVELRRVFVLRIRE